MRNCLCKELINLAFDKANPKYIFHGNEDVDFHLAI